MSNRTEYGCLMLFFDMDVKDIHFMIDPFDIYKDFDEPDSYGLENEPHVTLLFGFHCDEINDKDLYKVCSKFDIKPIELCNASYFECEDYDVLKFEAKSDGLHDMNFKLRRFPHTNKYDDYNPHCTIGYLKKGTAKKYVEKLEDFNLVVAPNKIVYSKDDGKKRFIRL